MTRTVFAVTIAALIPLSGCSESNEYASETSAGEPEITLPAETTPIASGEFSGRNDHVVTGSVRVASAGGKTYVVLDSEFSLDDAPDPKIGFGSGGEFDTSTTFTDLKSKAGEQVYLVPDTIDVSAYNEVYIWCDKFSVPLGIAAIE